MEYFKTTMEEIMIYFVLGIIVGFFVTLFSWVLPLKNQIKDLRTAVHDCIKSGLL